MFLCGNVVYATFYERSIRKEVKKLPKEGWKPLPNAISLEEQLKLSYDMLYKHDSLTNPIYNIRRRRIYAIPFFTGR